MPTSLNQWHKAPPCASERSSDLAPMVGRTPWSARVPLDPLGAFSALISAPLRLCGESTPSLSTTPEAL
jgi:hypothetical protein